MKICLSLCSGHKRPSEGHSVNILHYQSRWQLYLSLFLSMRRQLMCWCCYSKGWGRVSIAITVSCHSWTVGVRSCPETWPSRSWTKDMFPFWASLNVCFAIFKLPWLWPFRDGLSWQEGIDSQGKNLSLQKEKTPHRCLFTAGFPCCCPSKAVLNKTIWNFQGINSVFPDSRVTA